MSTTSLLSTNAVAVNLYSKKTWVQMMQATAFGRLFNRGAVYTPQELMGKDVRGASMTFPYVGKLTGAPVGEGGTLIGNTEALDIGNFTHAINVTRIGVENPNEDTIEQQRTEVPFSETTQELLTRRASEFIDASVFYQLAGANPTSVTLNGTTFASTAAKLHIQGHNTPIAPTATRIVRAGAYANDQSITSSDKFTLDLLDYALELNYRSDQPIETFDDGTYDLFVSPEQIVDLKLDTTGRINWFNIQLARITGGLDNQIDNGFKNGLVTLGTYGNINILQAPRVAFGLNSGTSAVITTVRRAVLVGRNALSYSSPFGGRPKDKMVPVKFYTELRDLGYIKATELRMLYGIKKMSPSNGEDIGSMVISTYAASHA